MENTSSGPENLTDDTTVDNTMKNGGLIIFLLCLLLGIFIMGLIGNGLVIFLTGFRMKTTIKSLWFLNLAIADFIFMLSTVTNLFTIFFNKFNIEFFQILVRLNLFASIYFLAVISLDRCLCTWMAVWAQNKRTLLRARIVCMIVWVLSIVSCFPYFTTHEHMFLAVYEFTADFLIPFLIIASSHIAIGVRIRRLKVRRQLRSYRQIITVILAFFICSFPYHVCNLYETALKANWVANDQGFWIAFAFSCCLVYLNSCLNPVLYVFMCDEYKKKLKQSLLLVLETAFAEDHLKLEADVSGQRGQQSQT